MSLSRLFNMLWDRNFEDVERVVKAFPRDLEADVRAVVNILPFSERTLLLAHRNVRHLDYLVSEFKPIVVQLCGEELQIPYRIYLNEPTETNVASLSELQKVILHCLYLRHHDGYVRQKHLEQLCGRAEKFICPYSIQLLGEYVIELLLILKTLIEPSVIADYAEFLSANSFYWKQTQSRMVSYWNEYYRQDFPRLKDYVGKHLIDRLNLALNPSD